MAKPSLQEPDPTRTLTIRKEYSSQAFNRWRATKGLIRAGIVDRDVFGLKDGTSFARFGTGPTNEQVNAFMQWFRGVVNEDILETSNRDQPPQIDQHWMGQFIRKAYAQGVQRSRQETKKVAPERLNQGQQQGSASEEAAAAAAGVAALLTLAPHDDGLDDAFSRAWSELQNVAEATENEARRVLFEELPAGLTKQELADIINERLDKVAILRSRRLARTEVIRTHANAELNELERLGIQEVGAEIELVFTTAMDPHVCPQCRRLEGQRFSIQEARGVIPVHPNPLSLDTDIYTDRGWVPIGEVTRYDQALSLNPDTFDLGWQPVIYTIRKTADLMVQFTGPNLNHRVSDDHNLFVFVEGAWQFVEAFDVPDDAIICGGGKSTVETYSYITDYTKTLDSIDEEVACVTLPEWHTLLARRNGKANWTGNCRCHWIPTTS